MKHPWDSQQYRAGARASGRSDTTIKAAITIAQNIKRIHSDLPVILTLHHLSHLCDVDAEFLQDVIFRKIDGYRTFQLRKGRQQNGQEAPRRGYRTISVPFPLLMRTQRWIAQNILNVVEPHSASFAFAIGRDLVGAAEKHAGARWLAKVDVKNFFESITERQVYFVFRSLEYPALLSFQLARICTRLPSAGEIPPISEASERPYRRWPQGHLPQGAPTSPMLANLAVRPLDVDLAAISGRLGWTFTRYADDLAFSRKDACTRASTARFVRMVERSLRTFGLGVQHAKTSIVPPRSRKVLLGVLVDRERPRLTRSFRNNLETHLYALTSKKIGVTKHMSKRGFSSRIGMRRHIAGLLAFAHQVDREYAAKQYRILNEINW